MQWSRWNECNAQCTILIFFIQINCNINEKFYIITFEKYLFCCWNGSKIWNLENNFLLWKFFGRQFNLKFILMIQLSFQLEFLFCVFVVIRSMEYVIWWNEISKWKCKCNESAGIQHYSSIISIFYSIKCRVILRMNEYACENVELNSSKKIKYHIVHSTRLSSILNFTSCYPYI